MRLYRALGLALALALLPSSLPAQTQFAVSGFGGPFLPASDLTSGIFFFPAGSIPEFPTFAGDVAATFRQKTAFQVGGRLTVWPSQRFGFEAEAIYALSDLNVDVLVPFADPGPPITVNLRSGSDAVDGSVFLGSVNAVFALIRPPLEPLVVFVSGGLGFVSRGGDAADIFENTTNVAGTWGFGLKYGVARGIWLRGDVRDYVYRFKGSDTDELEAKWQNDLLVSAGLEFSFGG
ncbi:MAG: hypothetical protein PVG79_08415 [Gemmatimonadales bacterium]|jgi:hypothetical protein